MEAAHGGDQVNSPQVQPVASPPATPPSDALQQTSWQTRGISRCMSPSELFARQTYPSLSNRSSSPDQDNPLPPPVPGSPPSLPMPCAAATRDMEEEEKIKTLRVMICKLSQSQPPNPPSPQLFPGPEPGTRTQLADVTVAMGGPWAIHRHHPIAPVAHRILAQRDMLWGEAQDLVQTSARPSSELLRTRVAHV